MQKQIFIYLYFISTECVKEPQESDVFVPVALLRGAVSLIRICI